MKVRVPTKTLVCATRSRVATAYRVLEYVLRVLDPLFRRVGHHRLDTVFLGVGRATKGLLLDSQSCGQCIVGFTGLSCPMNCPKKMRRPKSNSVDMD